MASIKAASAWANGEVGYVVWEVGEKIKDCLGFMVTRVHETGADAGARRPMPTWVAFRDQSNPNWEEQDSSVWPIQGYQWRDLTLRRSRNTANIRPIDFRIHYEIAPVGLAGPGRKPVPISKTAPYKDDQGNPRYEGNPRQLFFLDKPTKTNSVDVTHTFSGGKASITATFTNGILSTQNLLKQLQSVAGPKAKKEVDNLKTTAGLLKILRAEIVNPASAIRKYLAGDVVGLLRSLLDRAAAKGGEVYLALYELQDPELIAAIKAGMQKGRAHVILSTAGNTDPNPKGAPKEQRKPLVWDTENNDVRESLHALDNTAIQDRLFNNSSSIGHDKFAVYVKAGKAKTVVTGSTNWTQTGLCTQSNNAIVIDDDDVADAYFQFWQRLHDDQQPARVALNVNKGKATIRGSEPNKGIQGEIIRTENATPFGPFKLGDKKTSVTVWCSPNTHSRNRTDKSPTPPDLNDVYWLMDRAKKAIFFLTFLPGKSGKQNIIGEAASLAESRPDLAVIGAVSDPKAMPAYTRPDKNALPKDKDGKPIHVPPPAIWWPQGDQSKIAFIRAAAVRIPIGNFHPELLTAGHAIIHDKIIVVDPLDEQNCAVITGSHNLGYKASYANDENLLIIRGNRELAVAYALHVLDVYDHYVFRARLEDEYRATLLAGKTPQPDEKIMDFSQQTMDGRPNILRGAMRYEDIS